MKQRLQKACPFMADKSFVERYMHAEGLTLVAVLEIMPSS
jgi:hypothetical protein